MFKHTVVFLLLLSYCLSEDETFDLEYEEPGFNRHIVGGFDTNINSHPYIVSLFHRDFFLCGGCILSEDLVVTAAHCFHNLKYPYYEVHAGSTILMEENEIRKSDDIIFHPLNVEGSFDYDIALIFLEKPLTLSKSISPITLANVEPPVNAQVSITGWGLTHEQGLRSDLLQEATVIIIEREMCEKVYHQMFTPRMLCAGVITGGIDSCQSDSGGPMVYEDKLLGVISYGLGCGRAKVPGVYQSIPVVRDWIINAANNRSIKLE